VWVEWRAGARGGMTALAGSPNYGRRGLERDAELQVEFTTADARLCAALRAERDALWAHARAVGPHLAARYGARADVWSAAAHPERALKWRAAWADGVWVAVGRRVLGALF